MPFNRNIVFCVRDGAVATLLRVHPRDHWWGLVEFSAGTIWCNASLLAALGWRPAIRAIIAAQWQAKKWIQNC